MSHPTLNSIRNPREAAAQLGISMSTLAKWRMTGRGPRYVKMGQRVGYTDADLADYVAQNRFASTSEYPAVPMARPQ